MSLQGSGPIAGSDINVELGRSSTAEFSMGSGAEQALCGNFSGSDMRFSDFYDSGRIVVTCGNSGVSYGYNPGIPIGSVSPGTYKGVTILVLQTQNFSNKISLVLDGLSRPASFFERITTSIGTFLTSAATVSNLGAGTKWEWSSATMFPGSGTITVYINA